MKVNFLLLALLCILGCGCVKGTKKCNFQPVSISAPGTERSAVLNYLNSKGISATEHPSGFYYNVLNAGSGSKPEPCNIIGIQYTARLTNDSIFDATPGGVMYNDRLGTLIPGLQLGLNLVASGGSLQLFIPPTLGYGGVPYPNTLNPVVPANSILIYDVTLSSVQ